MILPPNLAARPYGKALQAELDRIPDDSDQNVPSVGRMKHLGRMFAGDDWHELYMELLNTACKIITVLQLQRPDILDTVVR